MTDQAIQETPEVFTQPSTSGKSVARPEPTVKTKLVRSNDTYYIGDVRRQITNLKAQYLQMHLHDPYTFSEENYLKGVKATCARIARHFGVKFNKQAVDLKDEINALIAKIPAIESKETEETLDEIGIPEIRPFAAKDEPLIGVEDEQPRQEENEVEAVATEPSSQA